jgi:hypothetical protein
MVPWDPGFPGAVGPWFPWCRGILVSLVPWGPGFPGAMGPWFPCCRGALVFLVLWGPGFPGAVGPWFPWCYGALVSPVLYTLVSRCSRAQTPDDYLIGTITGREETIRAGILVYSRTQHSHLQRQWNLSLNILC